MRLVGAVGPGDVGDDDVDRVVDAGECEHDRVVAVVHRDAEVAREQVAGAEWHDAHRNAGVAKPRGDRPHRAVAAGGDHEVDAGVDGLARHALARVVLGRLDPHRRGEVLPVLGAGDGVAQCPHALLRGVEDHGRARARPRGIRRLFPLIVRHEANGIPSRRAEQSRRRMPRLDLLG